MKKFLMLAVVVCMSLTLCGLAYADLNGATYTHVFVNVVPNIAVSPMLSNVDLGTVQTGAFGSGVTFRIDANTEKVKFMAGVSQLYKGDVTTNPIVEPIAVGGGGVVMTAEQANPINGHSSTAAFVGDPTDILGTGYIGNVTEWVTFESAQNNHFSQSITLTPTWVQANPEKPIGEYSGVVALWAMVVPVGGE
jgi:hypothetical protein